MEVFVFGVEIDFDIFRSEVEADEEDKMWTFSFDIPEPKMELDWFDWHTFKIWGQSEAVSWQSIEEVEELTQSRSREEQ